MMGEGRKVGRQADGGSLAEGSVFEPGFHSDWKETSSRSVGCGVISEVHSATLQLGSPRILSGVKVLQGSGRKSGAKVFQIVCGSVEK